MWTAATRGYYERKGLRYPSDMTEAEWSLIAPLIPPAKRGGRRREVDEREVLNAILYVLETGCQWRALPKDLPPRSTVHSYFMLWEWDGTLERIHHALYEMARDLEGRSASPSAGVIDSQDRDGALLVLNPHVLSLFPFLECVFADSAYVGGALAKAMASAHWRIEIVKRCDKAKGFEVLPKRWVVERTIAWINRCRRLAKDYEVVREDSPRTSFQAI